MSLSCRFYKHKFPECDEVVMVNVRQIAEMNVYVDLLEYNKIEGMIQLNELSTRRIRSINKLIRVDSNEAVVVIRVNKEKSYIDLSKKRVSSEEIQEAESKFARGKTVNSILRHTAEVLEMTTGAEFEDLYEKTAWRIDDKYEKPGYAYDFFKQCVTEPSTLDEFEISAEWKETLMSNIRRRFTPQTVKCRADVEVSCYNYEGIDAIKTSLKEGLKLSTWDKPIKINLIAPPAFVITCSDLDRDEGIKLLQNVIEKIKASIESSKGRFKVKMSPKVVTDLDEAGWLKINNLHHEGRYHSEKDERDKNIANKEMGSESYDKILPISEGNGL